MLACGVCYNVSMKEEWKSVVGYEGLYEISNLGRIKSLNFDGTKRERIMSPYLVHGYSRIRIFKNSKPRSVGVHRLVAEAFIANPDNKPYVNHINGDKSDNRAANLEWCTQSENTIHSYRVLMNKASGGREKKKVMLVETGQVFESIKEASKMTGHNRTSIISCCKGRYKTVNGMHWRYL